MREIFETFVEHGRLIWAIMMRELATRYGRNNVGFLWVIFEPLVFCVCVLALYRSIRGPYENGISLIPFILTGYMPTILTRHIVMYSVNAVKINNPLLYHKSITVLDLFLARTILEFIGVTFAAFIVFGVLFFFGLVPMPVNVSMVYTGWFITALVSFGMALLVGAISEIFEVVERIIGVALYILVPLSGTFFLADWLPPYARDLALKLPFLHCAEMIRYGFFGPSVNPHYDIGYAAACGAVMFVLGLILVRHVRDHVEVY